MIRSLTIKLVLLAGTLGFILALNWSGLDRSAEIHRIKVEATAKHSSLSFNARTITGDSNRKNVDRNALDLNLSTAQELETLPGIGPILAKRIVDHRVKVGVFHTIQALSQVNGIGKKKLQALRPLLKIPPNIVAKNAQG